MATNGKSGTGKKRVLVVGAGAAGKSFHVLGKIDVLRYV
jgi:hypothetical protein